MAKDRMTMHIEMKPDDVVHLLGRLAAVERRLVAWQVGTLVVAVLLFGLAIAERHWTRLVDQEIIETLRCVVNDDTGDVVVAPSDVSDLASTPTVLELPTIEDDKAGTTTEADGLAIHWTDPCDYYLKDGAEERRRTAVMVIADPDGMSTMAEYNVDTGLLIHDGYTCCDALERWAEAELAASHYQWERERDKCLAKAGR